MTTTSETLWEIPEPLSTSDVRVDDDTVITLRRHGNPAGPRLVLSHGSGLAIDLYYPFWSLLLDDFDLVIYDLRNHGWNAVSAREKHNVPTFVSDHDIILEAIDRNYGKKPKIGVYHSIAALTTLLSPTKGSQFSGYVLFDPPLCKRGASYEEFDAAAERLAAMVRRRAHRFRNREQLTEVLSYIPTFQRTVPGFFDLMARTTLRECENGEGYELRCPRDFEAQVTEYAAPYAVLVDFATFHCPIKVIGADPTLPYSYLPTLDLSHILTVDYDFLPETTHLLQVEQPEECAAELREFIERNTEL
ncbi:MAG: alpha/beta hydrolase [Acidobacteriota bacterium]|nr:alpha/beta hydrolase [Acidobacteriota bacterium]